MVSHIHNDWLVHGFLTVEDGAESKSGESVSSTKSEMKAGSKLMLSMSDKPKCFPLLFVAKFNKFVPVSKEDELTSTANSLIPDSAITETNSSSNGLSPAKFELKIYTITNFKNRKLHRSVKYYAVTII